MVRNFPLEYQGVEVCVARPRLVTNSATWAMGTMNFVLSVVNTFTRAVRNITQEELAAAVLGQTVSGFEQEVFSNAELVRLGQAALHGSQSQS